MFVVAIVIVVAQAAVTIANRSIGESGSSFHRCSHEHFRSLSFKSVFIKISFIHLIHDDIIHLQTSYIVQH